MAEPTVTVITAARNAEPFIDATIASIRTQTFGDWEYLIVDDASEDATTARVEDHAGSDPRIRLIRRTERGGPYVAANAALAEARGRYVARIDADDIAVPDRIARQLEFLEGNGLPSCITPWRSFDERGVIERSLVRVPVSLPVLKWYLPLFPFSSHSSFTIATESLRALGGYRELPAGQDFRIVCDLVRRGWIGVMPDVLAFVRRHARRMSSTVGDTQQSTAIDVMRDHLSEIDGTWRDDDLEDLWRAGHAVPTVTGAGFATLRRWARASDRDDSLSPRDRDDLAYLFQLHVRRLYRSQRALDAVRARFLLGRVLLRDGPRIARGRRHARAYEAGYGSEDDSTVPELLGAT